MCHTYGYIGEARHTPHTPDKSHIPASCLGYIGKTRGRNVTLVRNMWSVSCFTDVAIFLKTLQRAPLLSLTSSPSICLLHPPSSPLPRTHTHTHAHTRPSVRCRFVTTLQYAPPLSLTPSPCTSCPSSFFLIPSTHTHTHIHTHTHTHTLSWTRGESAAEITSGSYTLFCAQKGFLQVHRISSYTLFCAPV